MVEWIKQHPYLSGGLVLALVVLFLIIRRGGSSAPQGASGPSDALQAAALQAQVQGAAINASQAANAVNAQAAVATANSQAQAAVNIATLQANAAIAQVQSGTDQAAIAGQVQAAHDQLAASLGVASSRDQLSGLLATVQGQTTIQTTQANDALSAVNAQVAGQVQENQDTVSGQVQETGIQAGVQNNQIAAALAAQKDINATSVAINGANSSTQKYLADVAAGVVNNQTAAQLAALNNTNATNLAIVNSNNGTIASVTQINANRDINLAGIAGGVTLGKEQIDVNGQEIIAGDQASVYNNLISSQHDVAITQLQDQFDQNQSIINLIGHTDFNLGGQGGVNVASVYSSIFGKGGAPPIVVTPPGNTIGGIISAIGGAAGNVAKGLV